MTGMNHFACMAYLYWKARRHREQGFGGGSCFAPR